MHRSFSALPLVAIIWSAPALAGDEPLYEETPAWVDAVPIAEVLSDSGPSDLLRDWQYRIEDGVVYAYTDFAVRIDNPQSLMAQNTQNISWLPDKGDLVIHTFEIHRDGEVIDLIEQGVTFDVLRREQGLEYRLIDGQLTATVSVPGLREDDVLRIAYTVSTDDQALGDEVQALQFLPSEPLQVGTASVTMSWPADEDMFWGVEDRVELAEPVERDGYRYLSVDLPLEEADPVPYDAPYRFRRPTVLRVGSFASWNELSEVMTPHFETAARLEEGSEVAAQAAAIMAASDDPLTRAAMAVRLVQDEISYLLNGLEGGNYLPQSAEDTWDIRYGDCKAKSVLLLALLREMGIDSEVVLVTTNGGDAVPELLPLPAAFNHMIVRAEIDGTEYWLDGTSAGTRLATMADVPPFHYALPLREGGSDLVPMVQRDLAVPRMAMEMTLDHSAGVDFPATFRMTMRIVGAAGAQMEALVDAEDPQMLQLLAQQMSSTDEMQISNLEISYDDEEAVAMLVVEGVSQTEFSWDDGRVRTEINGANIAGFNPDRARPSWREIPVATTGPMRVATNTTMLLPQGGEGFILDGDQVLEGSYGNTRVSGSTTIEDGRLLDFSEVFSGLGEVPAEEITSQKLAAQRLQNRSLELLPPDDIIWRWELSDAEREERAAPILAAYSAAIDFADEDDHTPRMYRGHFLLRMFDYDSAMDDFNFLAEEIPSTWVLNRRSWLNRIAGDVETAEADLRAGFDLEPNNSQARELAQFLMDVGRADEALELLESMPVSDSDRQWHVSTMAHVQAALGNVEAGQALLDELIEDMPTNASALNSDCWYRGVYMSAMETALARCMQAIERSSGPSNAIDSRALIHFREGRYEEAIADLDAALDLDPEQTASYLLRGVVRLHAGDEGGEEDLRIARLMDPVMVARYERYGIVAPD